MVIDLILWQPQSMRIIAFIDDYKVIKKILDWLGIDDFKRGRPPPKRFAVADLFEISKS